MARAVFRMCHSHFGVARGPHPHADLAYRFGRRLPLTLTSRAIFLAEVVSFCRAIGQRCHTRPSLRAA